MKHDAFVSYASSDRVVAYKMVAYLESCGVRCWVAPRDVPGGSNYAEAILNALVESKIFLLIFSESSNASEHVQREVERALHLSRPIVPVRIKDVLPSGAMDYYLATLHWVDAFAPDGEDSEAHAEIGREDAARAAGALLGRDKEVRAAIAEICRKREEAEQQRAAAELEARLKAEAEARAKIEAEAEAERRRAEAEQQRLRDEALERQRKQEQLEAEKQRKAGEKQREKERRHREAERAGRERREAREKSKAEAQSKAIAAEQAKLSAAAAAPSTVGKARVPAAASTRQRLSLALVLLVLLVGVGIWAKGHFQKAGRDVAGATPQRPQPVAASAAIARLRASFEWAGERHAVMHPEVLLLSSADATLTGKLKSNAELLEMGLPDSVETLVVDFTLAIPGFAPLQKSASISEGETEIDFGALTRLSGELSVRSDYADQPRAGEAHQPFLTALRLVWRESVIDPGSDLAENAAAVEWVNELLNASRPEGWQGSPVAAQDVSVTLPAGRYRVVLETDCRAPFDKVNLADVDISATADAPPLVSVPIFPLGVFGGETAWTSTTTEAGRDEDGTVAWTLYNLPVSSDFSGNGPRLVQSYTDIVSEGQLLKKYYLPAAITAVGFELDQRRWRLLVDPASVVNDLDDDDLTDRYFEKLEFYLSYHSDKRGILFDAETVDQPLNATEGSIRKFTLQNAYPDFAEAITTLAAPYPGFGVLDLNKVYAHLEPLNKMNADAYRRSATTATSIKTPVPVTLGIEPDLDFAGSGNVRIKTVVSGGPGDESGLKAGDLLTSLGGVPVADIEDYYRIRFSLGAGIATEIQVLRDGETRTLVITPLARN